MLSLGRILDAHRPLVEHAVAICSERTLRKLGELTRELLRRFQRVAWLDKAFHQADLQRFHRGYWPAAEDQIEGATLADHARQAHCAEVDERHAEASVEHTKRRVVRRDAEVAPQGELEPTR